jgi:iron complex outermembrane recepter protein
MDSSMDAMTIGANGVKVTENLPSAMMAGANMELNCRPWKFLHFGSTLSYTYGSAKDGAPLPLVPPLRTMVTARYIYGKGWLQLECEMNAPQNRTSPAFGERTTPAYGLLNLRAGHEFRIGAYGLSLSGGVENIMDANYRHHLDWGGIPRPGINGYLNVSFSF